MSIIWDLKKIDLSSNPKPKKLKIFNFKNKKPLYLTKSYSFNNIKSQKTPKAKSLFTDKSIEKEKLSKEKLINKNIRLKIKLNNINKKLILAKSASHKKICKLQQNNKLLSTAINIKKLTLDCEQNNLVSTSYEYNKERENDIIMKGFKSNLIHKIKKQYLDLENDYKKKQGIILDLKNNINNSNYKNIISKNKNIMDNLIAIKKIYDTNLGKNNEYKLKMKEYIELEDNLSKKNFCVIELKDSLNDINCSNFELDNDIEKLKNKLKSLEKENEILNEQYYTLNEKVIQTKNDKKEIENKYAILIDENKEKNENFNFQNLE